MLFSVNQTNDKINNKSSEQNDHIFKSEVFTE